MTVTRPNAAIHWTHDPVALRELLNDGPQIIDHRRAWSTPGAECGSNRADP